MVAGFHLDDLHSCITRIQAFALSDSTKRNYHSVWNTYLKFCQFYSITPFPDSSSTIAAFITLLGFSVKSHRTVNNYLSALRRLHVFCHFETSAFDDIHVKLTQKGLEKSMVHLPHRKAPLTPAILLQFYHHLNVRDSAHLAVWCALLVGFFSFFRTANLVPQSFEKVLLSSYIVQGQHHFCHLRCSPHSHPDKNTAGRRCSTRGTSSSYSWISPLPHRCPAIVTRLGFSPGWLPALHIHHRFASP